MAGQRRKIPAMEKLGRCLAADPVQVGRVDPTQDETADSVSFL